MTAVRVLFCTLTSAFSIILGAVVADAVPVEYRIDLTTCDVHKAGTDSNVQGRLWGTAGISTWLVLDGPQDDRERGHTDIYRFTLPDLGQITHLELWYDHAGDSPNWCLDEGVVRGPRGLTIHPYHNWLTTPMTLKLAAA